MAPLTGLCVAPYLETISSFLKDHETLHLSSCTRSLRRDLLPLLNSNPLPQTPGVLALERVGDSRRIGMVAFQVGLHSMEHLDTTLNRIGRLRGLKRLIVGDFVGFQFTDLTMDRVLPPLNWDWLTSLIETMEEADWEGLEELFLACHFGLKVFRMEIRAEEAEVDDSSEEEGGTDEEDNDDFEDDGDEETVSESEPEDDDVGDDVAPPPLPPVVLGLSDLLHNAVDDELRVAEVPPPLLCELVAHVPSTLVSLNVGGLACCFPEAAFDAVLSGLSRAALHRLRHLVVPGMFKGGEASLLKMARLLEGGALPSLETMRFAMSYSGPDDMTPLLDALPHCPNLRLIKFGTRLGGGVPHSNLHHMLRLIREGRLPRYGQPPLCDLPVLFNEADLREAWTAVADVFKHGGLAEATAIDMCFSKPALDGPTLRLLLDSLPGHFETLETLRLRTTTDDEEQLLALASLLSPENLPALQDLALHCEGPVVPDHVLEAIFKSALSMPTIQKLELTWKHHGEGVKGQATLAQKAGDLFLAAARADGDEKRPLLPLDDKKVVALVVASAATTLGRHTGCLYLLRMGKDDKDFREEGDHLFPYDEFFDQADDITMPAVIQDWRLFSVPANSGLRQVSSKGGIYSRIQTVTRSSVREDEEEDDDDEQSWMFADEDEYHDDDEDDEDDEDEEGDDEEED